MGPFSQWSSIIIRFWNFNSNFLSGPNVTFPVDSWILYQRALNLFFHNSYIDLSRRNRIPASEFPLRNWFASFSLSQWWYQNDLISFYHRVGITFVISILVLLELYIRKISFRFGLTDFKNSIDRMRFKEEEYLLSFPYMKLDCLKMWAISNLSLVPFVLGPQ